MIDFHCHLDLYPHSHEVVRQCEARGLYVLSVTTTPTAWSGTSRLADGAKRIRTALGLHPQLVHERKGEIELFEDLLPEVRYVGEIGLDGAPEFKPQWDDQVIVFRRVLKACQSIGGRVLSIHSRRAATAVLDYLEEAPGAGTAILHWFSGTQRELARAISLDCWFSVGPAMIVNDRGRRLVGQMPIDRVLTESDGPFAQICGRPALPWDVDIAVRSLTELWGSERVVVQSQLDENLRRLCTA